MGEDTTGDERNTSPPAAEDEGTTTELELPLPEEEGVEAGTEILDGAPEGKPVAKLEGTAGTEMLFNEIGVVLGIGVELGIPATPLMLDPETDGSGEDENPDAGTLAEGKLEGMEPITLPEGIAADEAPNAGTLVEGELTEAGLKTLSEGTLPGIEAADGELPAGRVTVRNTVDMTVTVFPPAALFPPDVDDGMLGTGELATTLELPLNPKVDEGTAGIDGPLLELPPNPKVDEGATGMDELPLAPNAEGIGALEEGTTVEEAGSSTDTDDATGNDVETTGIDEETVTGMGEDTDGSTAGVEAGSDADWEENAVDSGTGVTAETLGVSDAGENTIFLRFRFRLMIGMLGSSLAGVNMICLRFRSMRVAPGLALDSVEDEIA